MEEMVIPLLCLWQCSWVTKDWLTKLSDAVQTDRVISFRATIFFFPKKYAESFTNSHILGLVYKLSNFIQHLYSM